MSNVSHDDEAAFWEQTDLDHQAERRDYEQRATRQGSRARGGGIGRDLGHLTAGAVRWGQDLWNRTGRPVAMPATRSAGVTSSLVELKASLQGKPGQFDYHRMEDPDNEQDEDHRGWAPVVNLDLFFQSMYKYYQSKGFPSILASGATNLVSMGFTVALSTWLFAFVDWGRLTTCSDEESCQSLDYYVHSQAVPHTFTYTLVWMYSTLFCCYWAASCYWFLIVLKDAAEMRHVYEERLGISCEELVTLEWHEVVQRFISKQHSGEYRVSLNPDIGAHDIACRIMRRENFLIALLNRGVLDLRFPLPFLGSQQRGTLFASTDEFLTRNLEWSLHVCVLNDMLNEEFQMRRDFLSDEMGLRQRFMVAGLLQLAMMPFLLVFMIMQFFLQNAQEWQQKRNYLGPRQWSSLAHWKFREYNEVPHLFERRLHRSYPYAMQYTRQCPRPVIAVLARCSAYISGSVVAVLLLFTLLDESIILYVKLWERNLLWYVGIFSAIFAMSRSLIPSSEEGYSDQEETMRKVAAHTHYYPAHWKGASNSQEVRAEFLHLFQYKTAMFQQEILSVLVTPLILCFTLPECARSILNFLRDHHQDVEGLGSVCSYSLFNLERDGTVQYGGRHIASQGEVEQLPGDHRSIGSNPQAVHGSQSRSPVEQEGNGKVEKSYLNFRINYPDWSPPESCEQLLFRLREFQNTVREEEEGVRSQQLHLHAQEDIPSEPGREHPRLQPTQYHQHYPPQHAPAPQQRLVEEITIPPAFNYAILPPPWQSMMGSWASQSALWNLDTAGFSYYRDPARGQEGDMQSTMWGRRGFGCSPMMSVGEGTWRGARLAAGMENGFAWLEKYAGRERKEKETRTYSGYLPPDAAVSSQELKIG